MNKILIALLAGVAAGVLIAPAKGSDTRKRLSKSFNDLTEDLEDEAGNLYQGGKDTLNTGKAGASVIASDVKNLAGNL